MQRPIYAITEQNVDGCGTDATEYLSAARPLTDSELKILSECLGEVRQRRLDIFHGKVVPEEDEQDLETYDMVQDAAKRFLAKTGRELTPAEDPLAGHLYF